LLSPVATFVVPFHPGTFSPSKTSVVYTTTQAPKDTLPKPLSRVAFAAHPHISWCLSSLQDPQTKQGKTASTKHGTLDEFELRNQSFDGSLAFWSGEGRLNTSSILSTASLCILDDA
jgi:hypothetical protein